MQKNINFHAQSVYIYAIDIVKSEKIKVFFADKSSGVGLDDKISDPKDAF